MGRRCFVGMFFWKIEVFFLILGLERFIIFLVREKLLVSWSG